MKKASVIKWYKDLAFPEECDKEFYEILDNTNMNSLAEKKDLEQNLIYFLLKCEGMRAAFEKRGIPDKYFRDTASEIVKEALYCRQIFGRLGIYETGWFEVLVKGEMLFRIGRLNFMLETAGEWCAGGDVHVGDKIVSVHIPGGEKLDDLACYEAFQKAERFILTYFPEHDFKCFICGSWLLYEGYDAFLKKDSNISKFRDLFKPYKTEENESIIKFAFAKNITRDNIEEYQARNSFQKKLQKYISEGGRLYRTFGTRARFHEDIKGIDCHYHQMQWFTDDMSSYPANYVPECENTGDIFQAAENYMEDTSLQGLNVLCMPNMEDLFAARDISQNILGAILKCENPKIYTHGSLIYPEFPARADYDFLGQAKRLIEMGFDGIKLIETKPNAHKKVGLPICHEAYEEFWDYLERENIHVLCHVNDPVFCWNEETMSAGKCYTEHYAHYETIYAEVLSVLEKHPELNITFAHFMFLGYDLDRLIDILERYKNVCIDITPAEEEFAYLSENPERAKKFFVKYSDRIMLGTDNKNAFRASFKSKKMLLLSRYLRTEDKFKGFVYEMQGIALDRPQLENILYRNFQRRVGERPRAIDRSALKSYIEELMPALSKNRTTEQIKNYLQGQLVN